MSRSARVIDDDDGDDGVHGGRMKPLASLAPSQPSNPPTRKTLMRCGGSRRAEEDKENAAPNSKLSKDAEAMDMLFLALDKDHEPCPNDNGNSTQGEPSTATLHGEPRRSPLHKWKPFCRQRSFGSRKRKPDENVVVDDAVKRSRTSELATGEDSQCLNSTTDLRVGIADEQLRIDRPEPESDADGGTLRPQFIRPAARIAVFWLELIQQDLKVRISALKRSRRRVRGVLDMFRCNLRQDQDVESLKWMALFREMDAHHAREGSLMESILRKVQEMQTSCRIDESGAVIAACGKAFASMANLLS